MAEFQISLTPDERQILSEILAQVLKAKRVEEHRTEAPTFREAIVQQERALERVLGKLNQTAAV
jgi:hypothetical protein